MDAGDDAPDPEPSPRPRLGLALLGVCAVLALIVLTRTVALSGEFYDAYEVRVTGQRLLAGTSAAYPPSYRSPLLILASAAFHWVGPTTGWFGPALISWVSYVLTIGFGIAIAWRLRVRPWIAALAGVLLASDHLLFVHAAHGLSYVPAAAASAGVLLLALTPRKRGWVQPVTVGLALGVAATLRPNVGLLGLALLAAFRHPWTIQRLSLAAACSLVAYAILGLGYFALAFGGLAQGWQAQLEVLRVARLQLGENVVRYGSHAPWLPYPRALLTSSPWLTLLACGGAVVAFKGRLHGARVLAVWALVHLFILEAVVRVFEARYVLPASPALAGLAALGLNALADRVEKNYPALLAAKLALASAVAIVASTGAWTGPYEVRRLSDPWVLRSFPEHIVARVREIAGEDARYSLTTLYPFPIVSRVVHQEVRYEGDPYFSMFHAGPIVLAYHLGAPVTFPQLQDSRGNHIPGLTRPSELREFVRGAVHPDGSGFRPGDVLLVGITQPSPSWAVYGRPKPSFGLGRVVAGQDGLEVELEWIEQ